jgi:sulfite reductase (NADPH) flavoprotein alpha-component
MLTAHKLKIIHDLINSSSKADLIWLNGYLAGIIAGATEEQEDVPGQAAGGKITIAYGTESGNSKKLAAGFAARAKKNGIHAKLVSLDQYRLNDLVKEEYFFTVISTQGDGEPPAAAKKFYDHIHQNTVKLDKLKYGVLALGDTAYPLFCKAGEDVDIQLQQLGAERIVSLQRCDLDYEDEAGNWFAEVLQKISSNDIAATKPATPAGKKSGGKKTYTGSVVTNINLNDRGSNKQTHHIEIVAADVDYQPGDSIGLIPENPLHITEAVIALTGIDRHKLVSHRNEEISIFHLLKKKLNIVYLPERVVKKYAAIVKQDIPETKIGLSDLLKIYPVKDAVHFEEVIAALEPTAPRLYSVSSSPGAHAGEIHLTVAKDFFSINEEIKYGLCSNLLTELPVGGTVEFYIHKNGQFRLPGAGKDIIMIGPGTGVAPFRSFLAERDATGATGRNWLFFGDQHFASDFLYQTEMQDWLQSGVLTKISLAFSRDQHEKIYVQHKMLRHGAEFFEWLQSGAHVYICGAKEPMSVDVENTILTIIRQYGNKNEHEALAYLDALKEAGRYVKDVY